MPKKVSLDMNLRFKRNSLIMGFSVRISQKLLWFLNAQLMLRICILLVIRQAQGNRQWV